MRNAGVRARPPRRRLLRRSTDTAEAASPKAFKEPYSEQALRDAARGRAPWRRRPTRWRWPRRPLATPPTPAPQPESAAPRPAATGDAGDDDDRLDWVWPARGKVVAGFSETANLKGIDIAGTRGSRCWRAPAGRSSTRARGLRGYGKLIIVKHNNTYLSAYAHNRDILVKEGQQVAQGPEDRGDGQHRRRPGQAALRDPPAGQAGRSGAYLPPA